jgi:DNA-binding MarR family transcriptional regulator
VAPNDTSLPKEGHPIATQHSTDIDAVVAGFERLMQRLADSHAPEFLEIDVTMPQAKILYLLGAAGELHMSDLVARLGTSPATVSGLVDRLVDHGLATRRDDPGDRRQVVLGLTEAGIDFLGRFRELNARQLRELVAVLDAQGLAHVHAALDALNAAAERVIPSPAEPNLVTAGARPAAAIRKDPA